MKWEVQLFPYVHLPPGRAHKLGWKERVQNLFLALLKDSWLHFDCPCKETEAIPYRHQAGSKSCIFKDLNSSLLLFLQRSTFHCWCCVTFLHCFSASRRIPSTQVLLREAKPSLRSTFHSAEAPWDQAKSLSRVHQFVMPSTLWKTSSRNAHCRQPTMVTFPRRGVPISIMSPYLSLFPAAILSVTATC